MKTRDIAYTTHLAREVWWKRLLNVQLPYRLHLQRLGLGRVLDVGCGVGRNLAHLRRGGAHVGVDHNPTSIALAKERGLCAYTLEEFDNLDSELLGRFDTILMSHLLEHLTLDEARQIIKRYRGYLQPKGRLVIITPQEAGFRSDPTHITMMTPIIVYNLGRELGFRVEAQYSFPFPEWAGSIFKYNEYVAIFRA